MSGMFQFRTIETSSEPTIRFSLSPEDALDTEQVARAAELEGQLDSAFAGLMAEGIVTIADFGSEDEAEILIPYVDEAMDDFEAEEALVITGVYVIGNVFLVAAFVTEREEDDEEADEENGDKWN